MRIAHTADWHLSFRSGDRFTPGGINQREADVARTFTTMVDQLIGLAPDVVVAAGDLFDRVNPGNPAIVHAFGQVSRLRAALPSTIVVLIAGNHDAPKSSGGGCILPLFASLGAHVVDRGAERLRFGELSILAVPDVPGIVRPALEPDPSARYNLLLLHGEVEGMPRAGGRAKDEIAIGMAGWDYIALGHYHIATEIAPNCWYSGSIDFTSSNPWEEIATPKGFIVRDLATGAHEFHPLPAARPVIDLPRLDVTGMTPEECNAAIAGTVEASAIDDAIVRLVVVGTGAHRKDLDWKMIREFRRRAMAFTFDFRVEAVVGPLSVALHDSNIKRETLEALVARKFAVRDLTPGVEREAFAALGMEYLTQATERQPDEPRSVEHVPVADTEHRKAS